MRAFRMAAAVSVAITLLLLFGWANVTFVCAQLIEYALPFPAHVLVVFLVQFFCSLSDRHTWVLSEGARLRKERQGEALHCL
jgi:zinc transporter ZupT